MSTYKLAVIVKNPLIDDEFLLLKQTPPPKFGDDEYDSYVDSDLWDLPWAQLHILEGESQSRIVVDGQYLCSEKLDLSRLDIHLALNKVLAEVGLERHSGMGVHWKFWKYVEEPEFGPGSPVHTVYITGTLGTEDGKLQAMCKWMSIQSCLNWLLDVKPSSDRVGPLAVIGLLTDSILSPKWRIPPTLHFQEYPPGVKLVPMGSRTAKPFFTTNLVIFAPDIVSKDCGQSSFVAHGEALIIDPGCRSEFHKELKDIVAALPRKLVVFVTHHHRDHVDDDWSLGYTSVSGDEEICIGDQRLRVIFAPGHTDGHVALLHVNTHSLIVGDHCVGQGSAILDITSGGNMTEYFQTTYKFMELSPHALIPMHGRVNLWPKHMLCGYLKNRRGRESSILKAIENGAKTLFDIVAHTYSDVDRSFWIPAASNVRLHVDHLAQEKKLPKEFSIQKFQMTCGLHFLSQWLWAYLSAGFIFKDQKVRTAILLAALAVAGFAVLYTVENKVSLTNERNS
ncbi:uncharacterized protein LOC132300745 isoform X2 [Cornus florida]|uniref:uncharacterized protein LOC132300745 isoform X2 n=1 Tax=Cornus florida TaxID=4283 RepID=UPI00289C37C5|nr:uncharacterized protein LOC132300745 isoform X2 [Cornus florida]